MKNIITSRQTGNRRVNFLTLASFLILFGLGTQLLGCSNFAQTSKGGARGHLMTQAPGFYRFQLGDFEITCLSDGTVKLPLYKIMGNISVDEARKLLADGFESDPPESSINAFLINIGEKLVLVDAGSGTLFGKDAGKLLENLRASGYEASEIDAILLTHLHKDHSGGLVQDGKRLFPNATIYLDKTDRDYRFNLEAEASAPPNQKNMFVESRMALAPYEAVGKVVLFEGNAQLFPGVKTLPAHGHTPGHTLYEFESKGQRIIFTGDLIHAAAIQFPRPEATIAFDYNEKAAAADRIKMLHELSSSKVLVGAAHISFPGLGYVAPDNRGIGYRWIPRPYSQ